MSNTDLKLNTDIIHNRTTTYDSLSDLYGVDLFTDEKIEERQQYEQHVTQENEALRHGIFVGSSNIEDRDAELTEWLFQEPITIAKKQNYEEDTLMNRGILGLGTLLICSIYIVIWIQYRKKHKRRED